MMPWNLLGLCANLYVILHDEKVYNYKFIEVPENTHYLTVVPEKSYEIGRSPYDILNMPYEYLVFKVYAKEIVVNVNRISTYATYEEKNLEYHYIVFTYSRKEETLFYWTRVEHVTHIFDESQFYNFHDWLNNEHTNK